MKALILAAGFGTRLEEGLNKYNGPHRSMLEASVRGKPKGLVQVAGKSIFEYQFKQLKNAGVKKEDIFIQTNQKYYSQFLSYANNIGIPSENVINNGVKCNEERLGPIKDLRFALNSKVGYEEPLIVMASDTLVFDNKGNLYDLTSMVEGYKTDGMPRIVVYRGEKLRLSKHGIVEVDEDMVIKGFEEKPENPKSDLVNASIHLYDNEILKVIRDRFKELEACRNIMEVVVKDIRIKAEKVASRLDIGTLDDVLKANQFINVSEAKYLLTKNVREK